MNFISGRNSITNFKCKTLFSCSFIVSDQCFNTCGLMSLWHLSLRSVLCQHLICVGTDSRGVSTHPVAKVNVSLCNHNTINHGTCNTPALIKLSLFSTYSQPVGFCSHKHYSWPSSSGAYSFLFSSLLRQMQKLLFLPFGSGKHFTLAHVLGPGPTLVVLRWIWITQRICWNTDSRPHPQSFRSGRSQVGLETFHS